MKKINLLGKGLFSKEIMNTHIKTHMVSKKEKILGHLIGPLGLIFVINTIAALVEKFFTQQVGLMYGQGNIEMIQTMGGKYELVMTIAKFLSVGLGVLNSWLISHTQSKQGRFRPWYLIFSFLSIAIGCLLFLFPGNTLGESYWYYFFTLLICYHTVGSSFFYVFRSNIISVSSRDPKEKEQLTFIRQMSWTLISGIIIGMLVSNVLIPFWLEKDINGYAILLIILSVIAIPLLLIEYFYTRERVTEDVIEEVGAESVNNIPLKEQMKALFTNKYWIILTLITLFQGILDNFKGGNVQYFYIKFMLNGQNNSMMYMLYSIITGIPLGIGAFAIYPIARKIGIKNMTVGGYVLVLIGSVLGWMFPENMFIALFGGLLRNLGWLPNAYIFGTLMYYVYDNIEFKSGIRLEGLLATGIVTSVMYLIYAPFAGGYEAAILKLGFVDAEGVVASDAVKSFMTMSFYMFDIILSVVVIVFLPFVNVEKKLDGMKTELLRRKKQAVLAKGEIWIEPEEQDKLERKKLEIEHEQNRITDLKAYCEKKGFDFEEENAKYLAEKQKRDEELEKEKKEKKEKCDKKLAKAEARRQARFNKLSPERKQKMETRKRLAEERFNKEWAIELAKSEATYNRYQTRISIQCVYAKKISDLENQIKDCHSKLKTLDRKKDTRMINEIKNNSNSMKIEIKSLKTTCKQELKAVDDR